MAATQAYEQPTLNKAWEAFVANLSTILLIWVVTAVLAGLGFAVYSAVTLIGLGVANSSDNAEAIASGLGQLGQLPFSILSSFVGVLFVAVPAMFYDGGEAVPVKVAFASLMKRPLRYLLAGILFSLVTTVGLFFCILPGIAIALVMPVYVNRIFLTDQGIADAFAASFQAVYRAPNSISFVVLELVTWLVVVLASVCTCGLGALVAVPVSPFYLQNAAYHKGIIS
jgi:hypothetical protein